MALVGKMDTVDACPILVGHEMGVGLLRGNRIRYTSLAWRLYTAL